MAPALQFCFLAFCLLAGLIGGTARAASPAVQLQALVEEKELQAHPVWRKLVSYKPRLSRPGSFKSDIVTDSFFLSPAGRNDPHAELMVTITAMLAPPGGNIEEHAQCRYPARFLWLQEELPFPDDVVRHHCPKFDRWQRQGEIESISLILATGYLSNPSSFYGHLLLKFNSGENGTSSDLLDTSINYGAVYPERENPVSYVVKGLAGGYESTFTHLDFYYHNHNYAENQLRDIWEYELNLSKRDTDLIVAHSWEMLGQRHRYYFLRQNCAYRMAEMVDLVLDRSIMSEIKPWVMPIDLFREMEEITIDDEPLIREVTLYPSRQNEFRNSYDALSESAQQKVRDFARSDEVPVEEILQHSSGQEQIRMLDTLIDYQEFVTARQDTDDLAQDRRNALIRARLQRPAGTRTPSTVRKTPPQKGQASSALQAGLVYNDEKGTGVKMRFRGGYYDLLSSDIGTLPASGLSIFDMTLTAFDDGLELRRLDLTKVEALSPSHTGLPGDGGKAWNFSTGIESRDLACSDCLSGFVKAGMGKSVVAMEGLVAYGMLNGRLLTPRDEESSIQLSPEIGLLAGNSENWKLHAVAGVRQELDGPGELSGLGRLEARFGNGLRWDSRVSVSYDQALESQVNFSYYW